MYLDTMCHWLVFLKLCTLAETEAEVKRSFRQIDWAQNGRISRAVGLFSAVCVEKKKKKIEPQRSDVYLTQLQERNYS